MSKLNPVTVTEETIGDAAFDGTRRRPVVAINGEGKLVVCCRSTARKHGWELQGALFQRSRGSKATKQPAAAKPAAITKSAPVKKVTRATDPAGAVVVTEGPAQGSLLEIAGLLAPKVK